MAIARYAAALAALFLSAASHGVIIDFEGVVADDEEMIPATPYFEDGFVLVNELGVDPPDGIFGKDTANTNGSAVFGWCGGCGVDLQPAAQVEVEGTRVILFDDLDEPFSIQSLDAAFLFPFGLADLPDDELEELLEFIDMLEIGLRILGVRQDSTTVSETVALGAEWTTHELAGFAGLEALEIYPVLTLPDLNGNDPDDFFEFFDPAIDNLVLNMQVDEPGALALLCIGLMGLGFARAKRPA